MKAINIIKFRYSSYTSNTYSAILCFYHCIWSPRSAQGNVWHFCCYTQDARYVWLTWSAEQVNIIFAENSRLLLWLQLGLSMNRNCEVCCRKRKTMKLEGTLVFMTTRAPGIVYYGNNYIWALLEPLITVSICCKKISIFFVAISMLLAQVLTWRCTDEAEHVFKLPVIPYTNLQM